MKFEFNNSFWEKLRVYRIWRGYGPAYFLELELQDNPDPDILFCVLCFDCAKTYIYKKNESIFDFDVDAPYQDKKLLPMCGLKILGAKIDLDNSLEMSLEQDYNIRVSLSQIGIGEEINYWAIKLNNNVDITFYINKILFGRDNEVRKSEYDLLNREVIDPVHYLDESLERFQKRMNRSD